MLGKSHEPPFSHGVSQYAISHGGLPSATKSPHPSAQLHVVLSPGGQIPPFKQVDGSVHPPHVLQSIPVQPFIQVQDPSPNDPSLHVPPF